VPREEISANERRSREEPLPAREPERQPIPRPSRRDKDDSIVLL